MASEKSIKKLRNQLIGQRKDIADWVVGIYIKHGNWLTRNLLDISLNELLLYKKEDILLIVQDSFDYLLDKFSYLDSDKERLYTFVEREIELYRMKGKHFDAAQYISPQISEWISSVYEEYNVDIAYYAYRVIEDITNKISEYWDKEDLVLYHIIKQFGKVEHIPFMRGRQIELESLLAWTYINNGYSDSISIMFIQFLENKIEELKIKVDKNIDLLYQNMSEHIGHDIEIIASGDESVRSVAIICTDCHIVLYDIKSTICGEKTRPQNAPGRA